MSSYLPTMTSSAKRRIEESDADCFRMTVDSEEPSDCAMSIAESSSVPLESKKNDPVFWDQTLEDMRRAEAELAEKLRSGLAVIDENGDLVDLSAGVHSNDAILSIFSENKDFIGLFANCEKKHIQVQCTTSDGSGATASVSFASRAADGISLELFERIKTHVDNPVSALCTAVEARVNALQRLRSQHSSLESKKSRTSAPVSSSPIFRQEIYDDAEDPVRTNFNLWGANVSYDYASGDCLKIDAVIPFEWKETSVEQLRKILSAIKSKDYVVNLRPSEQVPVFNQSYLQLEPAQDVKHKDKKSEKKNKEILSTCHRLITTRLSDDPREHHLLLTMKYTRELNEEGVTIEPYAQCLADLMFLSFANWINSDSGTSALEEVYTLLL